MAREEKTITELDLQATANVDRATDLILMVDTSDTTMSAFGTSKKVKAEAFVGDTGPMGPQGTAGTDGSTGPMGPQGTAGTDGSTGPMGPQGTAGTDGSTGPTGPQGIAGAGVDWKGSWNSGATYIINDGVSYNGSSYISNQDANTNHLPTDTGWWDLWVERGPTGPQGTAGTDGSTGPMGPQGTAGTDGSTGPTGADGTDGSDGATGPTGPDNITTSTSTDLTGYLYGDGSNVGVLASVPSGVIEMYGGSSAPTGYLLCDGSAVSRSTYANLFTAISTTYGTGDGSTTFNVPNLKGKVPVGYDSTQTEFDTLGETGGAKTHTLSVAEMPSHTHSYGSVTDPAGTKNGHNKTYDKYNASLWGWMTIGYTGGGEAHPNLQPYITLNYIIRT